MTPEGNADDGIEIASMPMPSGIARSTGVNGKSKRYGKHNAKGMQVAISRAIPAETPWPRVSLKTTATTEHIPPRKLEAWSTK